MARKRINEQVVTEENTVEETRTTSEQAVIDERFQRCAFEPSLDNDLRIIARNAGLDKCEQVTKVLTEWVNYKKLEGECQAQQNAGVAQDERCRALLKPQQKII